jgi:hypothetical protein
MKIFKNYAISAQSVSFFRAPLTLPLEGLGVFEVKKMMKVKEVLLTSLMPRKKSGYDIVRHSYYYGKMRL